MFVGNHEHTIDDKGRLILPSAFRARLADGAYVTTLDHCLAIVPTEEFARMADRLDDEVSEGLVDVNAVRAFFSQADFVTPDSQGRIRLLPHLRELVGLDRSVVVTGYNRDLVGEASLLSFTFAQIRNPGIGVIVAMAYWLAGSDHGAGVTTALILGARFYKRIAGHVLNVLSSVVMPLHKLDYYDENAIPPELRTHA